MQPRVHATLGDGPQAGGLSLGRGHGSSHATCCGDESGKGAKLHGISGLLRATETLNNNKVASDDGDAVEVNEVR